MNAQELAAAQLLWSTWERSQRLADEIDPTRKQKHDLAPVLDNLATVARDGFVKLTGHHPQECSSMVEINTVTPWEPWASIKPRQRIKAKAKK
jgi:hypothetical protein